MIPDSKVHGANMGPIWGRQDPGGPYVGPMNFAIWDANTKLIYSILGGGKRHNKCAAWKYNNHLVYSFDMVPNLLFYHSSYKGADILKNLWCVSKYILIWIYHTGFPCKPLSLIVIPIISCMEIMYLTHGDRVTHAYVSKIIIIGSDNGLSPRRCQAIIWTNAGILLIEPLGTNFSEILIEIHTFSFKKSIWKCRLEKVSHFVSASMC